MSPPWPVTSTWPASRGQTLTSRELADAYGVTDTDGSRPDCWGYIAEHGIDEQSGAGVDDYR